MELEESHLLLFDPDAWMTAVEDEELLVDDDDASSVVATPFEDDDIVVGELTGTLSDVVSDGDVFPFV